MQVTHPFGLALSGGGFRAAAFHLGVLRRLKELGLLAQVDVMSTVSGGSIAGAYWVYWQAFKGDTLANEDEWAKFENSLIDFMRSGVRERIFRNGFILPAALLAAIAGACAWAFGPVGRGETLVLGLGVLAASYVAWHYAAPILLQREYERLFESETLCALDPGGKPEEPELVKEEEPELVQEVARLFDEPLAKCPTLFINATLLNTGSHMFFSSNQDLEINFLSNRFSEEEFKAVNFKVLAGAGGALPSRVATISESIDGIDPFMPGLTRRQVSVPMPGDTPFSKAVASSSAIPFVFSPIRYIGPLKNVFEVVHKMLWSSIDADGLCWSVDGGVFDNQGTHLLLEKACSSVIVSDGSGALRAQPNPSTWQMFPPGNGVVSRSFDITYERSRDLGYIRLADKHALFCMLTDFCRLIGMPDLAPGVVDAVWRSHQSLAETFRADPRRLLTHPEEIVAFIERNRNLNDPAQRYDEGLLEEFRGWRRDLGEGTPRREDRGVALRDRPLKKLEKYGPYVTGYAYVELAPNIHFNWRNAPRLPPELIPLIASVRTDLDRFSVEEISALMFHGYTTIDHCLSAYRYDCSPRLPRRPISPIPARGFSAIGPRRLRMRRPPPLAISQSHGAGLARGGSCIDSLRAADR